MKKTNRYIILILVFILLVSTMPLMCIQIYADNLYEGYKELFEQRKEYLKEFGLPPGDDFMATAEPFISEVSLTVLLYTDVAKNLTFNKELDSSEVYLDSGDMWFCSYGNYHLVSPEIDMAINAQINEYGNVVRNEKSSHLRACIQYFDISKEELIKANELMQENPDAIRDLLTCLDDYEYEMARRDNGMFCYRPIPNFAIEALYLEDDVVANNLLCQEWSVYLGDHLNRVVTSWEIGVGYLVQVEELATCDLTPEWVGNFIENNRNSNNFAELAAARDAQLKAAETGDGAVGALWVIALALPALTVVAVKRKRRI